MRLHPLRKLIAITYHLPLTECRGAEGAFNFIRQQFLDKLDNLAMPSYVGRRSSGAAAEGVGMSKTYGRTGVHCGYSHGTRR